MSHTRASLRGVHTQHPNRYFNLLIFACSGCYSCSGHSSILGSIPSKTGKYIKMIVHFLLHHTVHYTKKDSLCTVVHRFWVSGKGKTEGSGWGRPLGAVHMAAARLDFKKDMVGNVWANSRHHWINKLRKHYSRCVGDSILGGKTGWILSGWMLTENADYCMVVFELAWLRWKVCLFSWKCTWVQFWNQSSDRNEDMVLKYSRFQNSSRGKF